MVLNGYVPQRTGFKNPQKSPDLGSGLVDC